MQLGTANLPTNRLRKLDVHCWKLLRPVVGPTPGMDWNQLCGNTMVPGHGPPMTARGERFKVGGVDSRFPIGKLRCPAGFRRTEFKKHCFNALFNDAVVFMFHCPVYANVCAAILSSAWCGLNEPSFGFQEQN